MSQHQIRTRDVLAGLGVDEYFASNGVPAVLKMLNDICETPADTAAIRGARYANLRIQADVLRCQLKNSQHVTTGAAESFLMNVTYNLWEIIFAKDHNSSSSSRQRYVAQHLTQYRSSRPLLDCWSELMRTCGVTSRDQWFPTIYFIIHGLSYKASGTYYAWGPPGKVLLLEKVKLSKGLPGPLRGVKDLFVHHIYCS